MAPLWLGQKLKPAPGPPQTGNVRGSGDGGVKQGPGSGSGATTLPPCGTEADVACGEDGPVGEVAWPRSASGASWVGFGAMEAGCTSHPGLMRPGFGSGSGPLTPEDESGMW